MGLRIKVTMKNVILNIEPFKIEVKSMSHDFYRMSSYAANN